MALQLARIMSTEVEVLAPDTSIQQAAERMRRHDIGMLPVCDGSKILGTVTDRDITVRATAEGKDPKQTSVGDVMSSGNVCYCFEDDDVKVVAKTMRDRQIRRMPVVDHEKNLVGIVSLADIARHSDDRTAGDALEGISQPS
ncbi:MAG TPA: CBS domain-containing protein [Polyangiaceae bacterium]|nr:CBS domain-containing protein [Polyangiaceae bacterium]